MDCTLIIKEKDVIIFNNVETFQWTNNVVVLKVSPQYTCSENADYFNTSTTPYIKRIYDVTNIVINH